MCVFGENGECVSLVRVVSVCLVRVVSVCLW